MILSNTNTNSIEQTKKYIVGIYLAAIIPLTASLSFVINKPPTVNVDNIVIRGVPASLFLEALNDADAKKAFFSGDKEALHDSLKELGAEEKIKEFYRDKISDENELDRYIHQIFYDNTGYVGQAYKVNPQGQLIAKY